MSDLVAGDLKIIEQLSPGTNESGGTLRLDWKGKSNSREPAKLLQPYFAQVAQRAVERKATVEMHFEALEHFNSSTITALIQFIQTSRSRGVPLSIVYDGAQKWQRLSFDALRIFEKSDGLLSFKSVS